MLVKIKDMQRFIRANINFDKKKVIKKGAKLSQIFKIKIKQNQTPQEQTSFKNTQTNNCL